MRNTLRRDCLRYVPAVLLLGCTSILAGPQRPQKKPTPPPHTPETREIEYSISPTLPRFTFRLIPDPAVDQSDDEHVSVRDIEVYRGESERPLQHLRECGTELERDPGDDELLRRDDFNFDGYGDLFLLTSKGGTGNESGCVWLFDAVTGKFKYNKEFSDKIGRYEINLAAKTITTWQNGGGFTYTMERFKVEKNHLVLILRRSNQPDERNELQCVQEKRQGNKMVEGPCS